MLHVTLGGVCYPGLGRGWTPLPLASQEFPAEAALAAAPQWLLDW